MNQSQIDKFFLKQAFRCAEKFSQDPNTQTGAILVHSNKIIFSQGANRIFYGLEYSEELVKRPEKYHNIIHAEKDVIFSAIRLGQANLILGSTMYATWTPCESCAEAIINAGIKRFITHQCTINWYNEKKNLANRLNWDDSTSKAIIQLKKCGVEYVCIQDPLQGINILFDDKQRVL